MARPSAPPLIGIAGWKGSGKTTLMIGLVEELTRRGLRVATIKHTHHDVEIDGGDSARHRRAGAVQAAIVAPTRWGMVSELRGGPEPALEEVAARLQPCDLVLVEGYKSAAIPKIEVRREAAASREPLVARDPLVMAIAADHAVDACGRPMFALDDVAAIANLIQQQLGSERS